MATVTSVGSGNWNADAATVWSTGAVPNDGDKFVIAAGHTITLDADYSGITNGFAASEIAGILQVSTSAGTYGLKLNGSLTKTNDAARFNIGTSLEVPLPSNVQFNLVLTANGKINMINTSAINWYCTVPSRLYSTIKTAANPGDTKIYVDHDLSTGEWSANRYIRIVDSATTYPDSEERQISSVGSDGGGYYVIVGSGLTGSKAVGSYVVLCHRNIHIDANSSSTVFQGNINAKIGCSIRGANYGFNLNYKCELTNCVISGTTIAILSNNGDFCNYCMFTGNSTTFNAIHSGIYMNSLITGTSTGATNISNCYFNKSIFSCNSIGLSGSTCNMLDCSANFTTTHFSACKINSFNSIYLSGSRVINYNYLKEYEYSCFKNDQQVVGNYYYLTSGGNVQNSTTQKPQGYTWSFAHAVETSSFPCFWQEQIRLAPNEKCAYAVNLYKTTTGWSTLPKAELLDFYKDPLVDSSQTALKTVTMTDSSGTWERFLLEYTNTTSYPLDLLMRVSAQNASGICYSRSDRILTQQPNGIWSPTWR